MLTALTRDDSPALAACELSFVTRRPIDVALAQAQHHAYQRALVDHGCAVIALPAQSELADSVFVEDIAIVLDEIAVLTRPGAASRRAESATIAAALAPFRTLVAIEAPGSLDGGDVLRIGRTLYVGMTARSNAAGIAQLQALVAAHGYAVQPVAVSGCLHLKSAVTAVADDTVLLQPAWVARGTFARLRTIEIDPSEPHAANALRVGAGVVYPDCFPRTRERLERAGVSPTCVDVSELQKAEGAVTCCSILFDAPAVR
jgi:dimethylargininase